MGIIPKSINVMVCWRRNSKGGIVFDFDCMRNDFDSQITKLSNKFEDLSYLENDVEV